MPSCRRKTCEHVTKRLSVLEPFVVVANDRVADRHFADPALAGSLDDLVDLDSYV